MTQNGVVGRLRERYVGALVAGDDVQAAAVVTEGLRHGVATADLYLELLIPAQIEIGDRWHQGRLNVAQEHLATQITLRQLERLRATIEPQATLGLRAVVAAVEGELHDLGARVVADFLFQEGWEVQFLGANTPTRDLVEFVRQHHPQLVCLSATLGEHLAAAAEALAALHALPERPQVVVGGAAVSAQPETARATGADALGGNALETVQAVFELMGLQSRPLSLEGYLQRLGERVVALRKQRRWSQQQLADASDLDRTYISALERGKQNLTIAAILRLAEALEVPLERLMLHP